MKKGFTMVEILAVFTITAVILLITVPLVTGMLKNESNNEYAEFKETIFLAAEAYVNDRNTNIVITNEISTITIGDLVGSGYLESTAKNPKNNKTVLAKSNKNIIIKLWRDDENVLNYEIEGF